MVRSPINPLLFNFMPSLEYDSWVTIGIEQTPNTALGQAEVQAVSSPGQNWLAAFSSGGGIDIDDATGGAWFVTNDATNGIAGENLDVLVAQLTTDGEINGVINFQLFLGGDPNVDIRPTVAVSSAGMASSVVSICGCTNPRSRELQRRRGIRRWFMWRGPRLHIPHGPQLQSAGVG